MVATLLVMNFKALSLSWLAGIFSVAAASFATS